jgi:2-methylcitrate dehydratase PrpD
MEGSPQDEDRFSESVTKRVAEFACVTDFGSIPKSVVELAKKSFLDCIGVALAGVKDRNSRIISEYVRGMGGKPESTILGSKTRVPSANAALANGVASHVMDFDDTCMLMMGHPSVISCPPSLAVGEAENSSGEEVLLAYIIGGEVACRMASALSASQYEKGWHNTSTMGIFGAAAAAGKLLALDVDEMAFALGIAASCSSGIKKNFGTSCKSYHVGQACSNGIRAALLAKRGFTSSLDVIEGKSGLAELLSGKLLDEEISKLGKPFAMENPGYSMKAYPSCAFTHAAIDAALELRGGGVFSSGRKISRVVVKASKASVDTVRYILPNSSLEAKFSMPFSMAVSILEGRVTLAEYENEKWRENAIMSLMSKVEFREEPEFTASSYSNRRTRVEVHFDDGTQAEQEVTIPKGDIRNPMSDEDLVKKYRANARVLLKNAVADGAQRSILEIENLKDINELTQLLRS